MLRIYFLQHWFQLSDPGAEKALYDSRVFREFAGIDLGEEPVADETTILKFRKIFYMEKKQESGEIQPTVAKEKKYQKYHLMQKVLYRKREAEAKYLLKKREQNRNKSRIRAKVEHIFHVLKRQFGS